MSTLTLSTVLLIYFQAKPVHNHIISSSTPSQLLQLANHML